MTTRITIIMAAAGLALTLAGGTALAQGAAAPSTDQGTTAGAPARGPAPHVPHHKVTPSHLMQHPRPVPEPQTIDALNTMSLEAARKGVNFVPPAPGAEHQQGGTAKP